MFYLLVEVHVLHLGFEQLHFVHGDGVLQGLLTSQRAFPIILLLTINITDRTTTREYTVTLASIMAYTELHILEN